MAIEEAFDVHLSDEDGEALIREIQTRIARGEFGDDDDIDTDAIAAFVRNRGPRTPKGQAGAAADPDKIDPLC